MMFYTHVTFALFLGLLMIKIVPVQTNNIILLAVIIFFSILPDLDCEHSFLGKKLNPISFLFKHRGFFHSIIFMVMIAIIVFLITKNSYYTLGVMIGFGSHLLLDGMTKSGIIPFWPSKLKIKGKLRTGGIIDWFLLFIFLALFMVLLLGC